MGRAFFRPLHHRTGIRLPTVIVCAGKRFKALIDSRAALLLVCTSVYNMIEDQYKTKILPAAVHLETMDGSAMSLLGKAALHLHTLTSSFLIPSSYVTSYWTQIFYLA